MDDLREVIARAVGETYDGCVDPIDTPNNWARATSATDAALAAIKQAGFVVVPAEPTGEMVLTGYRVWCCKCNKEIPLDHVGNDLHECHAI